MSAAATHSAPTLSPPHHAKWPPANRRTRPLHARTPDATGGHPQRCSVYRLCLATSGLPNCTPSLSQHSPYPLATLPLPIPAHRCHPFTPRTQALPLPLLSPIELLPSSHTTATRALQSTTRATLHLLSPVPGLLHRRLHRRRISHGRAAIASQSTTAGPPPPSTPTAR